jgi:predicted RNase H-like HicB family nuclease
MVTARVIYHLEDGAWWAESPDVRGWSAAADDLVDLHRLVEEGVAFALERDDVTVVRVAAPELEPLVSGARTVGAVARVETSGPEGLQVSSAAPRAGAVPGPAIAA